MISASIRRIAWIAAPVLFAGMLMGASPGKVTVCHKGSDLSVSLLATAGHLIHGDSLGSCAPPECPSGEGSCWVSAENLMLSPMRPTQGALAPLL